MQDLVLCASSASFHKIHLIWCFWCERWESTLSCTVLCLGLVFSVKWGLQEAAFWVRNRSEEAPSIPALWSLQFLALDDNSGLCFFQDV